MTYNTDKDIFEIRISELNKIKSFDMIKFKEENQELIEIIDLLIVGISKGQEKHFAKLTIIEKEEVLKNIFIEKEEDLSISETDIADLMEDLDE